MQHHPTSTVPRPADSCGLAIASLICGLCGVLLGPFAGIPAIITGHMALARMKRSGGVLQGHGMAVAGFGILAIIEVHPSEMDFARSEGGDELISRLKRAGHYPYSDLDREPVA